MNMEQRKQLNESEEYDKRVSGDKLREIIEIADKLNFISSIIIIVDFFFIDMPYMRRCYILLSLYSL